MQLPVILGIGLSAPPSLAQPYTAPSGKPLFTSKYDTSIKRAVKDYRPDFPWKRGKAQLVAESNLDPTVCSSVGACGIAQFMPGTWQDVYKGSTSRDPKYRFDAGLAITAWAIETSRLERVWRSPRPAEDRFSFVESSYNAGTGWILKAQQLCSEACNLWANVVPKYLPDVTGEHARETINYTYRIRKIEASL